MKQQRHTTHRTKTQYPNYQVQGDLLLNGEKNTLERTKFDRDTLNQEKHYNVTDPTSTVKPVSGQESTERCVLTLEHAEDDQTGTGRPSRWNQKEEHKIDFRVPGLSHAVVKEAEHLRVQELVQRIENHPHQAALQDDLQQTNINNPFSENPKEMLQESRLPR